MTDASVMAGPHSGRLCAARCDRWTKSRSSLDLTSKRKRLCAVAKRGRLSVVEDAEEPSVVAPAREPGGRVCGGCLCAGTSPAIPRRLPTWAGTHAQPLFQACRPPGRTSTGSWRMPNTSPNSLVPTRLSERSADVPTWSVRPVGGRRWRRGPAVVEGLGGAKSDAEPEVSPWRTRSRRGVAWLPCPLAKGRLRRSPAVRVANSRSSLASTPPLLARETPEVGASVRHTCRGRVRAALLGKHDFRC
jgi:hypothetical protein